MVWSGGPVVVRKQQQQQQQQQQPQPQPQPQQQQQQVQVTSSHIKSHQVNKQMVAVSSVFDEPVRR